MPCEVNWWWAPCPWRCSMGKRPGQGVIVHYTREPSSGLLMDVWILNRAELANEPWPTSPAEAASWRFDPSSQRWAR